MLVHGAKQKINDEFSRKEKDLDIMRSVYVSILIVVLLSCLTYLSLSLSLSLSLCVFSSAASKRMGKQKTRQFTERELLVQQLEREMVDRLSSVTTDAAKYSALLEGLIVQGAEKIAEKKVEVLGRREDKALVASATAKAAARLPGIDITVSESRFLSDKCAGGVKVTGLTGRIEADNTLNTRAKLALKDLQPVVRYVLFPSARAPVLEKPEPGSHHG